MGEIVLRPIVQAKHRLLYAYLGTQDSISYEVVLYQQQQIENVVKFMFEFQGTFMDSFNLTPVR